MTVAITLIVNGESRQLTVEPTDMLLDVLRDRLGYVGSNKVCAQGICGACTIIMDGKATTSCLLLAVQADGAQIKTVEGLEKGGRLDPLQEAFINYGAVQCGFCTPGFLMTARAFLDEIRGRHVKKSSTHYAETFAAARATLRSLRLSPRPRRRRVPHPPRSHLRRGAPSVDTHHNTQRSQAERDFILTDPRQRESTGNWDEISGPRALRSTFMRTCQCRPQQHWPRRISKFQVPR